MNSLHVGLTRSLPLPRGGFLYLHDELPDHPLATVFDPTVHALNPLKGIDPRRAQELAEVLYTVYPQGENTLTVRNGKWKLGPLLLKSKSFDKIETDDPEVTNLIADLLFLPTVQSALCSGKPFRFKKERIIAARLNRAEIGDRAALIIGLVLMNFYKGQIVIPDLGFYGRDAHVSLVRENRLIAGCNFLDELPPKLRRAVLLIKDKEASGALTQDAELIATYEGLTKGTNAFHDFVDGAQG